MTNLCVSERENRRLPQKLKRKKVALSSKERKLRKLEILDEAKMVLGHKERIENILRAYGYE